MIMGRAFLQPARPKHTRHANPHLTGTNAWCGLTPPQPPRPRHVENIIVLYCIVLYCVVFLC